MSISPVSYSIAGVLPILMDRAADPNRDDLAPFVSAGDSPEVRALVASAQTGDQAAFGALVAMHERIVFRTALAALGTREDAEDAAQEAFVMAWRRLAGFRGDSTFKTWLLTITWRKALDRRRSRKLWWSRQITSFSADDDASPLDVVATSEPNARQGTITVANQNSSSVRGLSFWGGNSGQKLDPAGVDIDARAYLRKSGMVNVTLTVAYIPTGAEVAGASIQRQSATLFLKPGQETLVLTAGTMTGGGPAVKITAKATVVK